MVRTCPGSSLILFGIDFYPLFRLPVENVNSVKTLLVCPSSTEDDEAIVFLVIVHRAVGAVGGDVSLGLDFSPFHGNGVKSPDVVHVVGIYVF